MAGEFIVTRVYNAETIRAEHYGVAIVVRLAAIETLDISDSEEDSAKCLALEAKSRLAEWVLFRRVQIEEHGLDEYNSVLGVVYLDGVNINLAMIRSGYARAYNGKPNHSVYLIPYFRAEGDARRLSKGIWSISD
jgi:endonuclease YncB( thermonuclease family)